MYQCQPSIRRSSVLIARPRQRLRVRFEGTAPTFQPPASSGTSQSEDKRAIPAARKWSTRQPNLEPSQHGAQVADPSNSASGEGGARQPKSRTWASPPSSQWSGSRSDASDSVNGDSTWKRKGWDRRNGPQSFRDRDAAQRDSTGSYSGASNGKGRKGYQGAGFGLTSETTPWDFHQRSTRGSSFSGGSAEDGSAQQGRLAQSLLEATTVVPPARSWGVSRRPSKFLASSPSPDAGRTAATNPPTDNIADPNANQRGALPDSDVALGPPLLDSLLADEKGHRTSRVEGREKRKSRGSVVKRLHEHHQDDVMIGESHRAAEARIAKEKKRKPKQGTKPVVLDLYIPSVISVGAFARLLNVKLDTLQWKMREAGMETEASYDHILTAEYASLLAMEFGRNPIVNDEAAFDIHPAPPPVNPSTLPSRPPVVTIMGHVDHGKTTLLDTLRSSSVAASEAGGITQHIGAFSVTVQGSHTVTFLDTPGHAAFSAMRARGARVTDVIVLVVAADDGVMPQTKEVIELTKREKGKVGLVVAINKVDKPGADVEKTQTALLAGGVELEAFDGDVPSVEVSGMTGQGLDKLVETISAVAELQDLRAEQDGQVQGYVLESRIHKGLGAVATVLVLRGTLKPGTHLISGTAHAKVRIMMTSSGSSVKSALPGTAITVSGWKELPSAGDEVLSGTEGDIKKALANRVRKADIDASYKDLDAINEQRRLERERREAEEKALEEGASESQSAKRDRTEEGPKELRLVIKGDVSGSVEAVVGAIQGIGNDKAVVKVISTGVGEVTENDVNLAKASEGTIVAFSVDVPRPIEAAAAQNSVPIYSTTIIYRLMDEVKRRIIELLPRIIERKVIGEATVLQIFEISIKSKQIKKIAGCRVTNGSVEKGKKAKVVRDGETVFEGPVDTLRQLKRDVQEVRKGLECGLSLNDFDGLKEGDFIQMYEEVERLGEL